MMQRRGPIPNSLIITIIKSSQRWVSEQERYKSTPKSKKSGESLDETLDYGRVFGLAIGFGSRV